MNMTLIPRQIEIAFWSYAITLMRDSEKVRFLIQLSYRLFQWVRRIPLGVQVAALSLAGLMLGLLVGFISAR